MDDLVQWLRAQLDEDERIAKAASEYAEAVWRLAEDGETVLWWPPEPRLAEKEREHGLRVVSDRWRGQTIDPGGARIAPHVAEHDPARVLREIDAKRQLLDEYEQAARYSRTTWGQSNADLSRARTLGKVVRLLALPYTHRPDYREEWRP